jgi:hypothetical protein
MADETAANDAIQGAQDALPGIHLSKKQLAFVAEVVCKSTSKEVLTPAFLMVVYKKNLWAPSLAREPLRILCMALLLRQEDTSGLSILVLLETGRDCFHFIQGFHSHVTGNPNFTLIMSNTREFLEVQHGARRLRITCHSPTGLLANARGLSPNVLLAEERFIEANPNCLPVLNPIVCNSDLIVLYKDTV